MMKMNFSFKGIIKAATSVAATMLLLLFVGSSVHAQGLASSKISKEDAKVLTTITDQYGYDFPTKPQVKAILVSELDALNSAPTNGALSEATKSVKISFLHGVSTHVREDGVSMEQALQDAYFKATVRAEDFTINVNTLQIFEEYYDLFTL